MMFESIGITGWCTLRADRINGTLMLSAGLDTPVFAYADAWKAGAGYEQTDGGLLWRDTAGGLHKAQVDVTDAEIEFEDRLSKVTFRDGRKLAYHRAGGFVTSVSDGADRAVFGYKDGRVCLAATRTGIIRAKYAGDKITTLIDGRGERVEFSYEDDRISTLKWKEGTLKAEYDEQKRVRRLSLFAAETRRIDFACSGFKEPTYDSISQLFDLLGA